MGRGTRNVSQVGWTGRLRRLAPVVLAGAVIGAVTVGVLSRVAMFALIRLNPGADGVVSDDGFEMGRFTLSGSLNLLSFGVALGIFSALVYLALERLRFGPPWFRTLSLSVGAGVVVASQIVHAEGVDFTLLEPLGLTVGLFVAIPVLHVALLDVTVVRIRASQGRPAPVAAGLLPWVARAGLAVLFAVALASLVGDVRTLSG